MIACAKCESPIELHSSVTLRFPKQVARSDDCSLLLDHCNEPAPEPIKRLFRDRSAGQLELSRRS
jgi:hypothetical protein